jgi:hypothetical protein
MDTQKVDSVLQYALAVAAEAEDYRDRELGPIHLVKYVYLADLAASCESGTSFTGTSWRFHHFGPWSAEVYRRIDPAVEAVEGTKRSYPGHSGDDAIRYHVKSRDLADRLERRLPWAVARAVKQSVRKHGNDTTALLHDVYRTSPMLKAAPGEELDFRPSPEEPQPPASSSADTAIPVLSKTRVKKLQTLVAERRREKAGQKKLVVPEPAPRYDEVFAAGQSWLDHRAGEPITPQRGRLHFADNVWKSAGRRDPEIP